SPGQPGVGDTTPPTRGQLPPAPTWLETRPVGPRARRYADGPASAHRAPAHGRRAGRPGRHRSSIARRCRCCGAGRVGFLLELPARLLGNRHTGATLRRVLQEASRDATPPGALALWLALATSLVPLAPAVLARLARTPGAPAAAPRLALPYWRASVAGTAAVSDHRGALPGGNGLRAWPGAH